MSRKTPNMVGFTILKPNLIPRYRQEFSCHSKQCSRVFTFFCLPCLKSAKTCQHCHERYNPKGRRRTKYCNSCAREVKLDRDQERSRYGYRGAGGKAHKQSINAKYYNKRTLPFRNQYTFELLPMDQRIKMGWH